MGFWIIVTAANLVVGALVGLCGVAGFLLPLVYTGPLGMEVTEGLALSFAAFILSGALGSANYRKAGSLDVAFGIRLSIGSLAGAILGVGLNLIIPEAAVKTLLYLVVLLSGISILLRKEKTKATKNLPREGQAIQEGQAAQESQAIQEGQAAKESQTIQEGQAAKESQAVQESQAAPKSSGISSNLPATLGLGFATGAICSMSGAGGPVLVMPLLVVFGIEVRTAVGVALFNSIFIGIPACIGYLSQCSGMKLLPVMAAALISHGIGVTFGSRNAVRINQVLLKKGIGVFSILIALWKLFG